MQTIRAAPWVSWVADASRLVLFDSRDGSYHALNESASHIWLKLADGAEQAAVAAAIAAEHGLSDADAAGALAEFVAGALAKGLLVAE